MRTCDKEMITLLEVSKNRGDLSKFGSVVSVKNNGIDVNNDFLYPIVVWADRGASGTSITKIRNETPQTFKKVLVKALKYLGCTPSEVTNKKIEALIKNPDNRQEDGTLDIMIGDNTIIIPVSVDALMDLIAGPNYDKNLTKQIVDTLNSISPGENINVLEFDEGNHFMVKPYYKVWVDEDNLWPSMPSPYFDTYDDGFLDLQDVDGNDGEDTDQGNDLDVDNDEGIDQKDEFLHQYGEAKKMFKEVVAQDFIDEKSGPWNTDPYWVTVMKKIIAPPPYIGPHGSYTNTFLVDPNKIPVGTRILMKGNTFTDYLVYCAPITRKPGTTHQQLYAVLAYIDEGDTLDLIENGTLQVDE